MAVLLKFLPWLLGGGIGTILLGRFLDTLSIDHQSRFYRAGSKFDRWIKSIEPLRFIFRWVNFYAKWDRRIFGNNILFPQAALVSFLIPAVGGAISVLSLPSISYPHSLRGWIVVCSLFGIAGLVPCWLAGIFSRLILKFLASRSSWGSIALLTTAPPLAIGLIGFLGMVTAASAYVEMLKLGYLIGFSIPDVKAASFLWISFSLYFATWLLNFCLLPLYFLWAWVVFLSALVGSLKYIKKGFRRGDLTKRPQRNFFTICMEICATWAVGAYCVILLLTYAASGYDGVKNKEILSLPAIVQPVLVDPKDIPLKLYFIFAAAGLQEYGVDLQFNREAMSEKTPWALLEMGRALKKHPFSLKRGVIGGTYHFSYQSRVTLVNSKNSEAIISLRDVLTGQEICHKVVPSEVPFVIATDLKPGFYDIHSSLVFDTGNFEAFGPFIHIYSGGQCVVMLDPGDIQHMQRIRVLSQSPGEIPTITNSTPTLKWEPVKGALVYIVNWGRSEPPNKVDVQYKTFSSLSSDVTWPEPIEDSKKYQWMVKAYDSNGDEIADSDPVDFYSTGGKEAFTVGQIGTIPLGTPSLGVAIAPAQPGDQGIRLLGVGPLSSAQKAGLQTGDILLQLNGERLSASEPYELALQVRKLHVGEVVRVQFERDGEVSNVPIKVQAAP